ncbi:PREDICTED: serine protease gd [Drosophila arizonae]|uniref:Serine protease gd n=1 Tax=Drosophila arizonae TaxID=7263 RepID=A0ABM1PTR9_DROAR|nr:PREDICTED: serine protease gd [Drosophila arizonae]
MRMQFTTILLICIEQFTKALAQGMPVSPCPKVFQYRFDGSEWFGLAAIRNPDVQALQIRITLSMRGKPTTNYLGEIELLTRGRFTSSAPVLYKIRFPKHHFPPKLVLISVNNQVICFGSADHSIFMTQIQLEHTRKLTFIADNSSSGLAMSPSVEGEFGLESSGHPKQPTQPSTQFKKKPFHAPGEVCGRVDKALDFRLPRRRQRKMISAPSAPAAPRFAAEPAGQLPVFDSDYDEDESPEDEDEAIVLVDGQGTATGNTMLPSLTRGAWPWLAAIYVNNLTSLNYQCGGTLVSARVVISSAHCFQMFNQRYTANEVLVFLGRHNLKNWNEDGSLAAPVDGIYIHSDYNGQLSNYDADIAVILLKNEVRFNTFIQPVCLWSGSSKMEYIVGEHGIVIGWSFDRSRNATAISKSPASAAEAKFIPIVVKAPIVSNADCFKANEHFRSLSSNRTFCAGFLLDGQRGGGRRERRERRGAGTGISGAGLMILRNNRWMLRGTVSAALPSDKNLSSDSAQCCTTQYIIYADVAKFLDWIMAFII